MEEKTGFAAKFRTWRVRLVLLLLIFSLLPLALTSIWYTRSTSRAFENGRLSSLSAIGQAKAAAIEQFMLDRKTEVERIVPLLVADTEIALKYPGIRRRGDQMPALGDIGADSEPAEATEEEFVDVTDSAAVIRLRETLQLILWDESKFEELLIIDTEGRVIAATYPDHEGRDAGALPYFREGLEETFIQPVFRSPITNRLSMVVSTPLRDASGETVSVFAARLNLDRLYRLVNDRTGLGETGEVVVGEIRDEAVVMVAPTRYDPDAALNRTVELGGPNALPIQQGVNGEKGSSRGIDYRGVEVFAAWNHIPSVRWGLVVKTDRGEVLAPIQRVNKRLLLLALILAAAIVVAALIAARSLLAPLYKLEEAADQVSRGNLDVNLGIRSEDEIGQLADSFERMIAAIRFFRAKAQGDLDEEDYDDDEYDEEDHLDG